MDNLLSSFDIEPDCKTRYIVRAVPKCPTMPCLLKPGDEVTLCDSSRENYFVRDSDRTAHVNHVDGQAIWVSKAVHDESLRPAVVTGLPLDMQPGDKITIFKPNREIPPEVAGPHTCQHSRELEMARKHNAMLRDHLYVATERIKQLQALLAEREADEPVIVPSGEAHP